MAEERTAIRMLSKTPAAPPFNNNEEYFPDTVMDNIVTYTDLLPVVHIV